MRIAISAGHGLGSRKPGVIDSGAVGSGYQEYAVVRGMAHRIGYDFAALGWSTLVRDQGYYASADDEAKAFGAKIFLELHLNAARTSARGVESIVGSSASAQEKKLATEINKQIAAAVSIVNRGVKSRSDLAILKQYPTMDSVLVEMAFISSINDMRNYQANVDKAELAIVNAVLKAYGFRTVTSLPRRWSTARQKIYTFLVMR